MINTKSNETSKRPHLRPSAKAAFTLLFTLLLCTSGRAQKLPPPPEPAIYQYPLRTLTVRDGLTRNQLYRVWEDVRGFVWVAGKRGLDRFDGLEVVPFQSDSTMQGDRVLHIQEEVNGRVWFLTNGAFYTYDGTSFTKREIPSSTKFDGFSLVKDQAFLQLNDGQDAVFFRESPQLDTLIRIKDVFHQEDYRRYTYFSPTGGLYVTTWSSGPDTLYHFSLKNNREKSIIKIADNVNILTPMHPSDTYRVIINDSLFILQEVNLTFERLTSWNNEQPVNSSDSPNGPIYRNSKTIELTESPFPQLHLSKDYNGHIHQRSDHLFIASEEGLKIIRPQSPVLLFPTERGMASDVWSPLEGANAGTKNVNGAKYFFPFAGGNIVKLKDGRYSSLQSPINQYDRFYPGATRSEDGTFLIPTSTHIIRLNPLSGQIVPLDPEPRRATNDILETGNRIYAATQGLAVYENDRLLRVYGDEDGLDVHRLDFFESVNEDRDGRLWLGAHRGLAVREPDGTFRNYLAGESITSGIIHGTTDHRGNLWFATHDGIALYDYTDTLPRWVTPEFHEDTKFVHPIDSTWLLIGGVSKLYLLDLPKFYAGEIDLYPFDEDDGFPAVEPLQASVMQDAEGIIWIGTTDGVVRLDPTKIKTYKAPTEPHFHSFSWLDESGKDQQTVVIPFNHNGEQSFTVKSTDQNIDIRFFTINHHKPHAMRFRHRLVGYRDSWSPLSPVRTVNYGELPPGNYQFELRACLYGNCTDAKTLGLRVAPARFWEYPVVKLGAGLVVLLVLGALSYTLYLRQRERRLAQLQAQAFELERAEARRQLTVHKVGPHFANNALTAITDLIIQEKNDAARRYTSYFAALFKPVLEDSLNLLWTLAEELEFINNYLKLEELRFGEKLSSSLEIDPVLEKAADDILVPSLLIQSFVNNAVKHGVEPIKRGTVDITISKPEADYLKVTITDNGPGLVNNESIAEGTGITAAQVMIKYLNQYTDTQSEITFSPPATGGTTATIKLYLHHQLID